MAHATVHAPSPDQDEQIAAVDQLAQVIVECAILRSPEDIVEFAERVAAASVLQARRERDRRTRAGQAFRVQDGPNFTHVVVSPAGEAMASFPDLDAAVSYASTLNAFRRGEQPALEEAAA